MKPKLIYFLLIDYWYISAGAIAAFLLIVFVSISVNSCQTKREQNKIDEAKTKIIENSSEINVAANSKIEIQKEVKNAQSNTNIANNNFTDSKLRDSSFFTSTEAGDKFCERYRNDSSCTEWRKYNFGR